MAKWCSPLKVKTIISYPFGVLDHGDIHHACGFHTGVDIVPASSAKAPTIYAPAGGKVVSVGYDKGGYGNFVIVKTLAHVYLMAHLRDEPVVKVGSKVRQGKTKIGVMGKTGNCTGRHLHFEIEKGSKWKYAKNLVNPIKKCDFKKLATGEKKS